MDAAPAAELIDRPNPLKSWFQLAARKTTIRREVLAGLTTFATMSYILVVNSRILSAIGIDTGVLISVTALAAALNTALMALVTNYPLALAPGMGTNAFFAYQVCSTMHVPWQAAFGLVFYNGILFLILAWSGLRQMVLDSFPPTLRVAITCGIGLFIAIIGLRGSHVLVANSQSFIALGDLTSPECLLFFVGLIFNTLLMWRGVAGCSYSRNFSRNRVGAFYSEFRWPRDGYWLAGGYCGSSGFDRANFLEARPWLSLDALLVGVPHRFGPVFQRFHEWDRDDAGGLSAGRTSR